MRAERLGTGSGNLLVLPEIDLKRILSLLEEIKPALVVVDSIQTMLDPGLEAPPGSVSQVRECTGLLQRYCKLRGVPVILVGHITRAGNIAGPMVLEHIVDAVLYFEGEMVRDFRILRALKNRFGSTREMGVFAMESSGLRGIDNPSEFFLSHHDSAIPGSVVVPVLEGSRTLLIEVQALVTQSGFGMPARRAEGLSANRLTLLLAVMEKRARLLLGGSDVFVNVVGGVQVDEPAADLGVVLAVASSLKDRPLPPRCCVMGEVGLGGEVRGVSRFRERIQEAARMGFERIILPAANCDSLPDTPGVRATGVDSLKEALEQALHHNSGFCS
jgi:DNA repair protein RadA/Sms